LSVAGESLLAYKADPPMQADRIRTTALLAALSCLLAAPAGCTRPDSAAADKRGADETTGQGAAADPAALAWPLFRGDPLASGVAPGSLPAQPGVVWKHVVENGAFEATAVIAEGRVFVGDADGTFYAFDLDSGEVKWTAKGELGFVAAAAVRDGKVYVGDIDGLFHCYDATDGKELWKHQAAAQIDGGANFHGENVLFGAQDGTLTCLRAADGEPVWEYQIDDQIRCSPTIVEGRAFLAGCDSRLHIVDVEQGKALADVEIDSPTGATPAVRGSRVFFGTEGGAFYAIDWKEARVDWRYASEERNVAFRSSAAVTGQLAIVGGRDKLLHALDLQSGEAKWTFPARKRIDSSPVVVESRVWVGSADGRLYALDLASGRKTWDYDAGGDFAASPAIAEYRLGESSRAPTRS